MCNRLIHEYFSESSFNLSVKDVRVRKGNYARDPLQITDENRKVLADEQGELKYHFITLSANDVRQPELATFGIFTAKVTN